ncbi:MAG TPA: TonB-dependent receptor [Caulobacteraceae bacterium]|nr:TonB-dependent receptor [Caulobacteraceae bacterium]
MVRALLMTTALVSLGGAGAAYAETAKAPAKETTTAAASAPAAAATNVGQVGEVVVTARRRAEDLQSVPVSVTAMSGAAIDQLNIRNFQDLRGTIPNLEVLPLATGGANLTIRGIGQGSSQVNVDAKTGFYMDEMYVARQEGNQLYFYDVDSVQVLKGPQGTLFGKNTTAGAFLLTSVRPSADAGGYIKLRAGNLKRIDTEGAINIPINDQLTSRISFRTQSADGYVRHVLDKEKGGNINDQSVRFQLRFRPNEKFTADLLGEYNKSSVYGNDSVMIGCRNNAAYIVNYNAAHSQTFCATNPLLSQKDGWVTYGGATLNIPTSAVITDRFRGGDVRPNGIGSTSGGGHREPFNDTDVSTVNLRLNYELTDDIALKSITAMRRSAGQFYSPNLNAPNDIYSEYDTTATSQFTEEVNLNGKAFESRLNYVLGAFYYKQNTHFLQDTGPDWIDPTGYTYDANNDFSSYAFYAQASYKLTEALELTVGGRYSHDKKAANSVLNFLASPAKPGCGAGNGNTAFVNAFIAGAAACNRLFTGVGEASWHSFDPRAQLSYQVTKDIFGYVSFTKGYNAGGFNQQLAQDLGGKLVPYNPEKLKAYEAGLKTEFWERRGRFNVAYFYQNYTDIQTTLLITFAGSITRQVQTGATAHESGIETEFELRPVPDLVLRANASYLRQHYDTIAPGVTAFTLTTPVNATPKFNYSVSADYTFHLEGDRTLVAGLNWRAVGRRPACNPLSMGINAASGLPCTIPPYGLLGGRLDFNPGGDSPWTASLWGTNLLDARTQISRNIGGGMGVDSITPGRPREYGIEIRRTF